MGVQVPPSTPYKKAALRRRFSFALLQIIRQTGDCEALGLETLFQLSDALRKRPDVMGNHEISEVKLLPYGMVIEPQFLVKFSHLMVNWSH